MKDIELRDYIAIEVMKHLISDYDEHGVRGNDCIIALASYEMADAMLKERDKNV